MTTNPIVLSSPFAIDCIFLSANEFALAENNMFTKYVIITSHDYLYDALNTNCYATYDYETVFILILIVNKAIRYP